MSNKKQIRSVKGDHAKITAQHKIYRIEKEIQRLEPLASARKAVELLQSRLEFWKNILR